MVWRTVSEADPIVRLLVGWNKEAEEKKEETVDDVVQDAENFLASLGLNFDDEEPEKKAAEEKEEAEAAEEEKEEKKEKTEKKQDVEKKAEDAQTALDDEEKEKAAAIGYLASEAFIERLNELLGGEEKEAEDAEEAEGVDYVDVIALADTLVDILEGTYEEE